MSNKTAMTIFPPVWLDPAYDDRNEVWRTLQTHGPYPLMAGSPGYRELIGDRPLFPFFRSMWATDGEAIDGETEHIFQLPRFVQAARDLYDAEIVRPSSLIVNVMGPSHDGGIHVDAPTYRGLERGVAPLWLLVVMGMSGLFERWAVRVAGGLTWFYAGDDGEFEFWPNGLEDPPELVRGPYENIGLVADNDLMYHRVRPIGDADRFERDVELTLDSVIEPLGNDGWAISDAGITLATLPPEEVRVSILWKALTFRDERAAAVFDQHEDDVDLDTIVAVFADDLRRRGVPFEEPQDPIADQAWAKVLTSTYMQAIDR